MKIDPAPFRFKQFTVHQANTPLKVGTDGVILGAWAHHRLPKRILDIGTGTGIIALMLAQRFPEAKIDAIDLNKNALLDAEFNFRHSPWKHRIKAINTRVQDYDSKDSYDLIVSNPPYFTEDSKSNSVEKDMARHQDSLNLSELMKAASTLMNEDSLLQVILPYAQLRDAIWEASLKQLYPLNAMAVHTVKNKPAERVMLSFKHSFKGEMKESNLHVYQEATWEESLKWRRIKEDFYLHT